MCDEFSNNVCNVSMANKKSTVNGNYSFSSFFFSFFFEREEELKQKRIALLFYQAKGATAGQCPQNCVSMVTTLNSNNTNKADFNLYANSPN